MSFTKQEQIKAILTGVPCLLLQRKFGKYWFETVDGLELFDVTADEVATYVKAHGFPSTGVVSINTQPVDGLCVMGRDTNWEVFYTERGITSDHRSFDTYEDAVRDVIRRLMEVAATSLNPKHYRRKSW